jgi:hypothetical protein
MGSDVPMKGALAALALLLVQACAWHGPQALQTWPEVGDAPEIVALDKAAWKLVAVQKRSMTITPDGQAQISLELANLSAKDLSVQVQTIFRNKDGMLTGDETSWQMVRIPGNATWLYEVKSLQPHPGSYLIQIKTP